MREAAAACGLGPGEPGGNDPRRIAAPYRRVRSDPALRRVVELAGRFRRPARSKQQQKLAHGSDDVAGVVLGGDVGKLLPREPARLVTPGLADDVLRRVVEHQATCRRVTGSGPAGRGPVIVCCDESGGTAGGRNHAAEAPAPAVAWVARRQKRWCAPCAYGGDSGERLLPLPPGRWDETAVLDRLSRFIGRGSPPDVPVRGLPGYYERPKAPKGKTPCCS